MNSKTVLPSRSESIITLRPGARSSFLQVEFEPAKLHGINGVYFSKAIVSPNVQGEINISVLNVNEVEIELAARTRVGNITRPNEIVNTKMDTRSEKISDTVDTVLIEKSLSETQRSALSEIIRKYEDIFAENSSKPKKVKHEQHRIITGENRPVCCKTRRIPVAWNSEVDIQITDMLQNDIIRPSQSHWNSPILLVKKKDNTTRFVCDFRGLNDVTKKDTYPLPYILDVIDKMSGINYWTKLDAAAAYWSVPVAEADKEKTAFSVPNGKFEFNVMPYGLCNAGATYQRMIDICLAGLPPNRVLAYMDDIIFNETFSNHVKSIEETFDRLRSSGISLKASKCEFGCSKIDFLGFQLSKEGIRPQDKLTEAINSFDRPKNRKEIQRFLGLANFYRHFIPGFSQISKPLTSLTSVHAKFEWTDAVENAFSSLKEKLTSEPVLKFPRFDRPFILEVDASDVAIGGVLSQEQSDNQFHPVAYFSNTLDKSKRNWSTYTKEAYALIAAVRHWNVYLSGKPFTLLSDHNPLVYLRKQKDPRGKFARWIAELEEFEYNIEYIPGACNLKADSLSRLLSNTRNTEIPESDFEEKIYFVNTDRVIRTDQVRNEQDSDISIADVKQKIKHGENITTGRFKRVQKQLRIEDGILTKSGRHVIPASMRKFVTQTYHSIAHLSIDKLNDFIGHI